MSLKLGFRNGDCIPAVLASDLAIECRADDGLSVAPPLMDVCREFAFSANRPDEFALWYLRSEAFSKFNDANPDTAALREQNAYQKFSEAEAACRLANEAIVGWDCYSRFSLPVWQRARGIIRDILGPFPWERFPAYCQFGPGASLELPRRRASQSNKWVLSTHITDAAQPYHWAFKKWSNIDLGSGALTIVDGNRVTTVPKSYKTDRTIAIEPGWNAFYQRGLGTAIRARLRRRGLLLPDAQQRHRNLAREGSALGHLATLDLSMASDSVGLALCEALLPGDWFRRIVDLRSPLGFMTGGEVVDYAKVSSMGNGFTFELETLIFYALTAACYKKGDRNHISVYGDDIVCPAFNAEQVMSILREAGFKVNETKSFWSGRFRESCGGHFFDGVDVTPFYIRRHPQCNGDAIVLHNNILEWCARQPEPVLEPFSETLKACKKAVPQAFRGPWGFDGCLWSTWDQATPSWNRHTQSYRQRTVKTIRWLQDDGHNWGAILQKLWVGNADTETSWAPKSGTMEVVVSTSSYRDQWDVWPVRQS